MAWGACAFNKLETASPCCAEELKPPNSPSMRGPPAPVMFGAADMFGGIACPGGAPGGCMGFAVAVGATVKRSAGAAAGGGGACGGGAAAKRSTAGAAAAGAVVPAAAAGALSKSPKPSSSAGAGTG